MKSCQCRLKLLAENYPRQFWGRRTAIDGDRQTEKISQQTLNKFPFTKSFNDLLMMAEKKLFKVHEEKLNFPIHQIAESNFTTFRKS